GVLTDRAMTALADAGLDRLELYVEGENTAAIRTYRRVGIATERADVQCARAWAGARAVPRTGLESTTRVGGSAELASSGASGFDLVDGTGTMRPRRGSVAPPVPKCHHGAHEHRHRPHRVE